MIAAIDRLDARDSKQCEILRAAGAANGASHVTNHVSEKKNMKLDL